MKVPIEIAVAYSLMRKQAEENAKFDLVAWIRNKIKTKGTMAKFEELKDKMESYEIMQRIANEYRSMIELIDSEKDYFRVDEMSYRARSDTQKFEFNSSYAPLPPTMIRDALQSALDKLEVKILAYKEDLKEWL